MMMNILALDLGTRAGWAISQAFAVASGSISFATNRLAGYGVRFLNFRNWLVEMIHKYAIDLVVFEDVRNHIGVYAAHAYGGFLSQLTAVCEEIGVDYQGYSVKMIKKFITGSGNANKQSVINAVENQGYQPIDDNEADALALLLLAQSDYNKEIFNNKDYTNTDKAKAKRNKSQNINKYNKIVDETSREIKNHKAKDETEYHKVSIGTSKVFISTGEVSAQLTYRQSLFDS